MLVPYAGRHADCKNTSFTGSMYINRRHNRVTSSRRPRPSGKDILFMPTSCGPHYSSGYSDQVSTRSFQVVCNGVKTTRQALKSAYNFLGSALDPLPSTSHCPTISTNKILLKIKHEKVNLGLALAEYRKTASAFGTAVQRVIAIGRAIQRLKHSPGSALTKPKKPRKNDPPALKRRKHQASKDYLLVRYGLLPTVQDMVGALRVLDGASRQANATRYSASETSVTRSSNGINQNLYPGDSMIFTYNGKSTLNAWVEYDLTNVSNQLNQLGLLNVPALAWELIPYSFVVDWLIPVGQCLQSLDALQGVSRVACTLTKRETVTMSHSFGPRYFGRAYSRSVVGLSPAAPRYKPSSSAIHIADALALLSLKTKTFN